MSRQRDPEAVRGWVALIIAVVVGAGVLMLVAASLIDVLGDPTQAAISPEYAALVQTTLGVLVGGLVGYLGGTQYERERERRTAAAGDVVDELELEVLDEHRYGDDGALPDDRP